MKRNQKGSNAQRKKGRPGATCLIGALVIGISLHAGALQKASAETRATSKEVNVAGNLSLPVRRSVETPSGRISYMEQGSGPVALFVHGVLLNSYL